MVNPGSGNLASSVPSWRAKDIPDTGISLHSLGIGEIVLGLGVNGEQPVLGAG